MSLAFNPCLVIAALFPIEVDVWVSVSGSTTPAVFRAGRDGDDQAVLVTLNV